MIIFFQFLSTRKLFVLGCFMTMLGSVHINIAGKLEQQEGKLKSDLEEYKEEYKKEVTELEATINTLVIKESLINYVKNAITQHSSSTNKMRENNIQGYFDKIAESIDKIKKGTQEDTSQYLNQINKIEDLKSEELQKKIKKDLLILQSKKGYLQSVQKQFQALMAHLQETGKNVLSDKPSEKKDEWAKKVWEKESEYMLKLLKKYDEYLSQYYEIDFSSSKNLGTVLLESKVRNIFTINIAFDDLKSELKSGQETNKTKVEKSTNSEELITNWKQEYGKEKSNLEKILEQLTIHQKEVLQETEPGAISSQPSNNSLTILIKNINKEIKNIKEIVKTKGYQEKDYSSIRKQYFLIIFHREEAKGKIKDINKMSDYLAFLQPAFKVVLKSIVSKFDQLSNVKNTKQVKGARNQLLVALLSEYHQALEHIKNKSQDGRNLFLLNQGYTSKKNEIIKKIKTIEENTTNKIKEIKKAVSSNTTSSLKPKLVNSSLNNNIQIAKVKNVNPKNAIKENKYRSKTNKKDFCNGSNSSNVQVNMNDKKSQLENEKVKLRKLLANTQKKYKDEMGNGGEYPFQELILDHPILKNATHNEISEALKSIKKSAQKIKKDYNAYLEDSKKWEKEINNLSSYELMFSSLEEGIQNPYIIFNNKVNHYLKPLTKECKELLDLLQKIQLLKANNQSKLDSTLTNTWERLKGLEVRKIVEKVLLLYSQDLDTDANLFVLTDSKQYKDAFNSVQKKWNTIGNTIKNKLNSFQVLGNSLSGIDKKIKEKQQEYSKKFTQLQVTINSLPVNQSLIDYTKKAAQNYSSPSTKEYEQSIDQLFNTIQASILEIKPNIQQDLPYTQYFNQINRIEDWKPKEFEKRMNEELASLDNQNTGYLQPIQKEFQKMVNLLATERKKALEVLPSEKHNHWMKKVWKKEGELISQLLEIYDDLIKKTVTLEFKKPEESLVNSYIDEIKGELGGIAKLQDLQSGIRETFSDLEKNLESYEEVKKFMEESKIKYQKAKENLKKNLNRPKIKTIEENTNKKIKNAVSSNTNSTLKPNNSTQADSLKNTGTTILLQPSDKLNNNIQNNEIKATQKTDDGLNKNSSTTSTPLPNNKVNDSIPKSTQINNSSDALGNQIPKNIIDPNKNNKNNLPLIVLVVVVILGLGGLIAYLLVRKKKMLISSSTKEVS